MNFRKGKEEDPLALSSERGLVQAAAKVVILVSILLNKYSRKNHSEAELKTF
jgi:hypothetical protein